MKMALVTLLCALALVALVAPGGARGDDRAPVDAELARLRGTWTFERIEANGAALPMAQFAGMAVTFDGERYAVTKDGAVVENATLKLDPSASPKGFEATVVDGPNAGASMHGIYELVDDTFKVCFAPAGTTRPTKFETASGPQTIVVHKRMTK